MDRKIPVLASGARDGGVIVWKAPTQLVWTPSGELIGCDESGEVVCWEAPR